VTKEIYKNQQNNKLKGKYKKFLAKNQNKIIKINKNKKIQKLKKINYELLNKEGKIIMLSIKNLKFTDGFVSDDVKEKLIDFSNSILKKISNHNKELNSSTQKLKSNLMLFFKNNEKKYKNIKYLLPENKNFEDFQNNIYKKLVNDLPEELAVFEYFEKALYDKIEDKSCSVETIKNDIQIIADAVDDISKNLFKILKDRNKKFEQLNIDLKNFEKLNNLKSENLDINKAKYLLYKWGNSSTAANRLLKQHAYQ
jgi:hypothetical protein